MNEVATVEVAALDVATVAADDAIAPDEVVADWVIIPHWPGIPPPPQVAGALHNPHATTLPQPSEIDPQLAPVPAQLFGAHVFGIGGLCPVPLHDQLLTLGGGQQRQF